MKTMTRTTDEQIQEIGRLVFTQNPGLKTPQSTLKSGWAQVFETIGYSLAPWYVEFVKFVRFSAKFPVRVAMRDAEPIWDTAQQMADFNPKKYADVRSWEKIWLCRGFIHTLEKSWEDRDIAIYPKEQKEEYYTQRINTMKYLTNLTGRQPFTFADTGINGTMSKVLNVMGFRNQPLYIVSSSRKNNYRVPALADSIRKDYKKILVFNHKTGFPGLGELINFFDSIPKKHQRVFEVNKYGIPLVLPYDKNMQMMRIAFDAGVARGTAEYLERGEPFGAKHLAMHYIDQLYPILKLYTDFVPSHENNLRDIDLAIFRKMRYSKNDSIGKILASQSKLYAMK